MKNNLIIVFATVLGIALVFLISFFATTGFWQMPSRVMCTQEAKLCSDGSYVGRTGPHCEFAKCPEDVTASWNTAIDPQKGTAFRYPENLSTQYINTVDWPPKIQILQESFTCTEAGSSTDRAGRTEQQIINGNTYCVTEVTEGAAGSMYTQYAYAFPKSNRVVILTFSLRFLQCQNYDEAERNACENERSTFAIDSTLDRIARTLSITTISQGGGIEGTVLIGPNCPGPIGTPECQDKPYSTSLAVTTPDDSNIVAQIASDENGKFVVWVPAGEYMIRSYPVANILPYCSSDRISVISGTVTKVTVQCDTGIR